MCLHIAFLTMMDRRQNMFLALQNLVDRYELCPSFPSPVVFLHAHLLFALVYVAWIYRAEVYRSGGSASQIPTPYYRPVWL